MKKVFVVLFVMVVGVLTACAPEVYTVAFEVDGGNTMNDYEYTAGDLLEMPEDPTKVGHQFVGWYYDEEFTEGYSLKDGITRDLVLFAKWEKEMYTVTIDYNNGTVDAFDVEYGSQHSFGGIPTKPRSVFDGWYADEALTNPYLFDTIDILEDTSFFAKWLENDVIFIGSNIYTFNDNFMNGLIRPELERYAAEREVEIEIVDSEGDQARLNQQVDVFIEQGVDVLAINLVNAAAAHIIINKAKAADIPLILFNKEPTESGIMDIYDKVWFVGTDIRDAGLKQGEMMVADWQANSDWDLDSDGVIDYVLLKGEPGHPDAEARTLESVKALTDAGITVNELALAASPYWSTADAKNTMDAWLTSAFADEIELVICNNDGMAFGAFQALDAASKVLPVYGIDGLDQTLIMIGRDEITGTVLNDGKAQARAVIDLAINTAKGYDPLTGTSYVFDSPSSKAVRIEYIIVNKENYLDFMYY